MKGGEGLVTKKHNRRVLIDLDEFQSMMYQQFYPKISHKSSEQIIREMEIMDKRKTRKGDNDIGN